MIGFKVSAGQPVAWPALAGRVHVLVERWPLLAAALVALLAAADRFPALSRGLGQDELFSVVNFVEPSSWRATFSNDAFNNHIGYSAMARLAAMLFGHSEAVLRAPAFVLGIASLVALFPLARLACGSAAAVVAIVLLAVSPAHVAWSVEARGYSALIFFTILSSWFYARMLRDPSGVRSALYAAAGVCAIWVHLYGALVVGVQVGLSVWLWRRGDVRGDQSGRLAVAYAAIALLGAAVYALAAPAMLADALTRGRSAFDPLFPWRVAQRLAGPAPAPVVAMALAAALLGWLGLGRMRPGVAAYAGALLAAPVAIVMVIRPADLYPRFFAYWLSFFVILIAAGLQVLWNAPSRSIAVHCACRAGAIVVLALLLLQWTTARDTLVVDEGYRQVARTLTLDASPDTAYCAIGGARSVWRFYLPGPVSTPASVADLQRLGDEHRDVRCAYYEASWQEPAQTQMAGYLFASAVWMQRTTTFPDTGEQAVLTSFIYRAR